MISDWYISSLHAVEALALLTMVGYFVGCMFRDRQFVDRTYVGSRHWMSSAMFLFAMLAFLQSYYHIRVQDTLAGAAVSLVFFFTASQLISMALVVLLRPDFQTKFNFSVGAGKSIVMALILGGAYHHFSRAGFMWTAITCNVVYFVDTGLKVFTFSRLYNRLKEELDNYSAADYESYLRWMPRSTIVLSAFGLTAPLILFAPLEVIVFYNILLAFAVFYVFICYERFIVFERYCMKALTAVAQAEAEDMELRKESDENTCEELSVEAIAAAEDVIREALKAWIAEKKFCQPDINIIDLSRTIGTNRTYLSRYINSTYNLSFRNWIAHLRIEESKILLLEPDADVEQIADRIGFSGGASFIRSFAQQEGLTPANYIKLHKHHR